MTRDHHYVGGRRRRWDRVSWWYSLILVLPILGFLAMLAWPSGSDDSGLSGVVKDLYTGEPVAGAVVLTANATATTNGDGRFSVDDETATDLIVARDDYESARVTLTGTAEPVEVALRPTTIKGTIKNERTDKPVAGVTVMATGRDGSTVSAVTDDEGKYVLENIPEGATITVIYEGTTAASRPVTRDAELDFEIQADVLTGKVVDEAGQPLEGATVSVESLLATTGADGHYRLVGVPESGTITVKKAGFVEVSGKLPKSLTFDATLKKFRVHAVYAAPEVVADATRWAQLLQLADSTEVNAIVLDAKDSTGKVYFDTQVRLANEIGATSSAVDLQQRLKELKDHDLYAIARVVVFEDPLLAGARPDLAIKDVTTGGPWTTWDGAAWVNAYNRTVWQYNIDIALEVANAGFDEVQFDHLRFPSDGILDSADYGPDYASESKVDAVTGFLKHAREALAPTGAYLAANVLGLSIWTEDDLNVGESFEAIAALVDVICPMIYPSHFYPGLLGFDIPNDHPYEVVSSSLEIAASRSPGVADKLRPWLQGFSYGEGIEYGPTEVAAQIRAVQEFGGSGWMIWNPTSDYSAAAFASEE